MKALTEKGTNLPNKEVYYGHSKASKWYGNVATKTGEGKDDYVNEFHFIICDESIGYDESYAFIVEDL